MTLRELLPMWQEKLRVLGELNAYSIAWMARLLTGTKLDVVAINPYESKARQEAIAAMTKRNKWRAMRAFVTEITNRGKTHAGQ